MVLLSKNEAPDNRGSCKLFSGDPFMTLQVVINKDFVLVATFDDEEVVRKLSLRDDDARNNKGLAYWVIANRENIE